MGLPFVEDEALEGLADFLDRFEWGASLVCGKRDGWSTHQGDLFPSIET